MFSCFTVTLQTFAGGGNELTVNEAMHRFTKASMFSFLFPAALLSSYFVFFPHFTCSAICLTLSLFGGDRFSLSFFPSLCVSCSFHLATHPAVHMRMMWIFFRILKKQRK